MLAKKLHMIAMILLVVGGVLWGLLGLSGVNLVARLLGKGILANIIYILVGIAALYVGFHRDTYLPFLGETVMPCSLLSDRVPEHADTSVELHGLRPGAKLMYWAAEPDTEGLHRINDWKRAYLEFANAGVTTVNAAGHATLRVRKPQSYAVPVKGPLERHVHWRLCGDNGLLGPVNTTPVV